MTRRLTAILVAVCVSVTAACTGDASAGAPSSSAPAVATSGASAPAATATGKPTPKPKPKPKPPAVMPIRVADQAPMSTLRSVTKEMLRRTRRSASNPVGKLSRQQVDRVRRSLVTYLAQQHAYRQHLCDYLAPDEASLQIFTPRLRDYVMYPDDEDKEWAQSVKDVFADRIASQGRSCEDLRWKAPGSVVGPQRLRFSRGKYGADLTVRYVGSFGYYFEDSRGRPELHYSQFRAKMYMNVTKSGGKIAALDQAIHFLRRGWFDGPLPRGYDDIMSGRHKVPRATVAAWRQVQRAVKRTSAWPAARWVIHDQDRDAETGKKDRDTLRATVAFRAGYAIFDDLKHPSRGERIFDHGRTDLSWRQQKPDVLPGESVPKGAVHWRSFDPTSRSDGEEFDTSPFVPLEILRLSTSAATRDCTKRERAAHAAHCFVVRTPASNAAYSKGIATRWGWGALTARHPWLDFRVGVDRKGRLVALARSTRYYFLGEPSYSETWRMTLSHFTTKVPPPPKRPRANMIARDGTYYP